MVELEVEDWQKLKRETETQIKQASLMLEVNTQILGVATARIDELTPPKEPKDADTA